MSYIRFLKIITRFLLLLSVVILPTHAESKKKIIKPDKPNILFIAVDDLRPELGCYGKKHIKSPNIDRLAQSGIVFTNAYCNYPVCGASRASLLSGLYPSINRFVGWNCSQDTDVPGVVSLPMHFRNNNYTTVFLGKIYNNFEDGQGSWNREWRPPMTTTAWDYQSPEGIRIFEERNEGWNHVLKFLGDERVIPNKGPAYERSDVKDITYTDGRIASRAIEELQNFENRAEPFFLAIGFHKPHLPFNAPIKYWNMYDKEDIKLPSNYNYTPKSVPDAAIPNLTELRGFDGIASEGSVADTTALSLIHGYYACVSYIDAQIGLVLNALENFGLANNTIIIIWGDHGFSLGEHGLWGKGHSFKSASHSPLIVRIPWEEPDKRIEALAEFVDIYPSLCELAGLSIPYHLQGRSFVSLIDHPEQQWKEAIFIRSGGETIVTETHSYTEWSINKTGQTEAFMLYDHKNDSDQNVNISKYSENKKLIRDLQEKLYNHIKERDKLNIP